jgi:periplasmic divalent cation tolerance protein
METEIIILYTTWPEAALAEAVGAELVAKRLAACVNILGEMTSIYEWAGKAEQTREVPMLVKTTAAKAEAAIQALVAQHPYDCPCVVQLPVTGGHPAFLQWIATQTR